MLILGIESSCDDTAVAVVTEGKQVLSHVKASQYKEHAAFGGVVPELAARSHLTVLRELMQVTIDNLKNSLGLGDNKALAHLSAIAVTAGPGLIGGLLVGVSFAKGMAASLGIPLLGINHLEGHILVAELVKEIQYPALVLLVSGGHSQLMVASGLGQYETIGRSVDDSVGEAFDKVAKMLGLGYPGGPAVELAASRGDAARFSLPRPMLEHEASLDFSFAGLKTAVRRLIEKLPDGLHEQEVVDICASFQLVVGDIFVAKLQRALARRNKLQGRQVIVVGGVAANQYLRMRLRALEAEFGVSLVFPAIELCTDNGLMIAWAGMRHFMASGAESGSGLELEPRSRWPL